MSTFNYRRTYTGNVRAVLLDWAGTTLDHGCFAPAVVFIESFRKHGVAITMEEARQPMGAAKRVHIQKIGRIPSVAKRWREAYDRAMTEADVDAVFADFVPMQIACLPAYSELIPGTVETVAALRRRGIKIGSTTGYTREMTDVLLREAKKRGYEPDVSVCASDVPAGRPEPFMCLRNVIDLGVSPVPACVKVDDTLPGIEEGLSAGMWTVGVAMTGNEVGLTEGELASLDITSREEMRENAYRRMHQTGAHFVVDSIADLLPCIDAIEARMRRGEAP